MEEAVRATNPSQRKKHPEDTEDKNEKKRKGNKSKRAKTKERKETKERKRHNTDRDREGGRVRPLENHDCDDAC